MYIFYWTVIILSIISLIYIVIYSSEQIYLHSQSKKDVRPKLLPIPFHNLPFVTIQLPVYNEKHVIEDLLDCICKLDYPTEKLEIQILDDSTDETSEIIKHYIQNKNNSEKTIKYIHRMDRIGYKAGALKNGLKQALGEYIAIFDADFRPEPNFLQEALTYFTDKNIAAVQTRWGFMNRQESVVTQIQAILINNHFLVEQYGRYAGGLLLQFSGTAGIWRTEAILEAGGWQSDTIIEDVDLSIRAQLINRTIVLAKDIVCPGELPVVVSGIKTQQFRWMQGAAQITRKHLKSILKSDFSLKKKYHAFVYITTGFIYPAIFSLALLSVPFLLVMNKLELNFSFTGFFFFLIVANGIIFYQNTKQEYKSMPVIKRIVSFTNLFFYLIVLNFGISFQNSIAVIKGLTGVKTAFKRTPKFKSGGDTMISYAEKPDLKVFWEILLTMYFLTGVFIAFHTKNFLLLDLHICLVLAFSAVSVLSLKR